MYDDKEHFQCSVYDLLNRYGFMEGESLIPEEKPLVEKASHRSLIFEWGSVDLYHFQE